MSLPAVIMAAGLGARLRPLTDEVPKPALPIDGRPVVATVLRELGAAGCPLAVVVTGHLAEQVERLVGDGAAFGVAVRTVRQPDPDGSADAVRRSGLEPPYLAIAADTLFGRDDVRRFVEAFLAATQAAGAIGVRRHPAKEAIAIGAAGQVTRVVDRGGAGSLTGAPLWALGAPVHERLCLDRPPYELGNAFQRAIDEGNEIRAVEIGPTRDLTRPLDLLTENFPYLTAIR
jgi:NDP-sugar pyrophosphorylase family protein